MTARPASSGREPDPFSRVRHNIGAAQRAVDLAAESSQRRLRDESRSVAPVPLPEHGLEPRRVILECGCEWFICTQTSWPRTDCFDPRHDLEVLGAEEALHVRGFGWSGRTKMDCGCKLWVV